MYHVHDCKLNGMHTVVKLFKNIIIIQKLAMYRNELSLHYHDFCGILAIIVYGTTP